MSSKDNDIDFNKIAREVAKKREPHNKKDVVKAIKLLRKIKE